MVLLNKLRILKSKKSYQKNSRIGNNIVYSESGRCTNCSGNPDKIKVGDNSALLGSLYVTPNGSIEIGDHFYLGHNSMIGSEQSIRIGQCVMVSNDVRIYDNNNHPVSPKARENMCMGGFFNDNWKWHHSASAPVVIEDNVWIGQYSTILKGVTIGKGSIVATRAVVTKDVPPYTIVAGNPAKVVKQIEVE